MTGAIWELVDSLVVSFSDVLSGDALTVLPGWPKDSELSAEMVFLSGMEVIESEVPGFVGSEPVMVDEVHHLTWDIGVMAQRERADAIARLEEIISALKTEVRRDPRRDEFPGLIECLFTTPERRKCEPGPAGFEAYGQLVLAVYIRLY